MPRSWRDIRSKAVEAGRLDESRVAEHRRRSTGRLTAHKLAEIRVSHGIQQTELAARLNISQPRVSRIESGKIDQAQIATLRAYVQALGGELEVVARFGEDRIAIE